MPFDVAPALKGTFGFRTLSVGPGADLAGPAWMEQVKANQQLAWSSSPAGHVFNLTSPLLIIQGDSDANVDFQETTGLVRALRTVQRSKGLPASHMQTMVFPDERHGLALYENQLLAAQATADFFQARYT